MTRYLVACVSIAIFSFGNAAGDDTPKTQLSASFQLTLDVPYAATDNPRQTLDLIIPETSNVDPLPVIVYVHGGAWMGGNKRMGLNRMIEFVDDGSYAVVSVGYRLSGETIWPSQIHDCKAAIRWIGANSERLGLDPERIGVWGDSAGGHLVAVLGTSADVESMDGKIGTHTDVSSRVACVVDYFGPTDFLQMNRTAVQGATLDHDADDSPESRLIGQAIQNAAEAAATANPVTYVTADDAPFLIIHGDEDPLVPFNQSELLHQALIIGKVSSYMITVDGGTHGGGFGKAIDRVVNRFFDHHLRDQKVEWHDQIIQASRSGP